MMKMKKSILATLLLLSAFNVFSQEVVKEASKMDTGNILYIAMGTLAGILLLVIFVLSSVVRTAFQAKINDAIKSKTMQSILAVLFLGAAGNSMAANPDSQYGLYDSTPIAGMHPAGFYSLFIVLLIELFVILWLSLILMRLISKKEAKVAVEIEPKVSKPNAISDFFVRKVFGVKSIETDKDVMLDHEYDGIRELDNDLPPWWKYGFYLTILSGIIYFVGYQVTHTFKSSSEEYQSEMAEAEASVKAYRASLALQVDETNAIFTDDPKQLDLGQKIFMKNCAVCHGNSGEGLVGPNFADKYWLYGNTPSDLFAIVKNGTNKGMKAWKDELSPVDIQNVIGYIHTIEGTNPPNAKEAQGELIELSSPEIESSEVDSTVSIEIKS
jgi:cytochrome c oxidase cbb3-type subunit 3